MLKTKPQIGPQDQGRRMTLKQFEPAQVQNGYLYELARGIVVVSEVPGFFHLAQVSAVRRPLMKYQDQHPECIYVSWAPWNASSSCGTWRANGTPTWPFTCRPPRSKRVASSWT